MTGRIGQICFSVMAAGLLAVGCLNVFKSPDWSAWRLAVAAGEFGHWLGFLALVAVFLTLRIRPARFAAGIALMGLFAAVLLFKPIVQAWNLGRELPTQLERDFGRVDLGRSAFTFMRLFGGRPVPTPPERLVYTGNLTLDFYRATARPNAPCIVLVHGGGWNSGNREEITHFNHWLASRGYAVAAIDYRLAPEFIWPAQRDDLTAAIAFLKARAVPLGIDASRLVLLGRSAGGQLAEATAYTVPDPAIRGVVALYAPADVHFAWEFSRDDDVIKSPQLLKQFLGGTPATARANYDSASAIQHVGKNAPPTLLLHGRLDTLVWHRQSERLAAKLQEAGVLHTFVSLPWATHGFDYNLNGPGGQLGTFAIEWFLASVTK